MPEWLIGTVSKTVMVLVAIVGSNPTLSACKMPQVSGILRLSANQTDGALLPASKSGSIRPIFIFSKSSGLRTDIHSPIRK